jgi:hypothetical protein
MRLFIGLIMMVFPAVATLTACTATHTLTEPAASSPARPAAIAAPLDGPINVDGRLAETAWSHAPKYPLSRSVEESPGGQAHATEGGTVRFLWDEQNLYVGFTLIDSDVVQEDKQDQQHHYLTGDVAELFIKPAGTRHYWEFYVTPAGNRSAFFFPGRGRMGLPSTLEYDSDLRVGAASEGTLNHWQDRDRQWSAELVIPWSELRQFAQAEPIDQWHVLVGRYNYSAYLSHRELTMWPQLPFTGFHEHEFWADLRFEQPKQ